MHIGGEPNTEAAKRPWLADIDSQREAILRCYRAVDAPGASGSFGFDLYVGRAGGTAEIRGIRQKLGGPKLEQCMTGAMSAIDFHPPGRPTVLSYSLYFELGRSPQE